jgi:hypothetical protein
MRGELAVVDEISIRTTGDISAWHRTGRRRTSRPALICSFTPSMIAASSPIPAITMKWVSSMSSPDTSTRSIARS